MLGWIWSAPRKRGRERTARAASMSPLDAQADQAIERRGIVEQFARGGAVHDHAALHHDGVALPPTVREAAAG